MKKFIAAMLCVIMIVPMIVSASALTPNQSYSDLRWDEFTVGDANGDGEVNMQDSLDIRIACAGTKEVDGDAADINADGYVDAKDLLLIKKCNAGIDDIANYDDYNAVDRFTIAGNDISTYSIVYDADAKYIENMYFSADTLRKYINMSTGVNLKVEPAPTAESEHNIFFVDVTKIEGLEEELGIENYKYEVKDGDLYIYGTRRGNMYAAAEIAEDYLGYRFYSDQWTNIYASRYVDIPEGTVSERKPYLTFRFCRQGFSHNNADFHFFPRRLNGSQISGNQEEYRGTLTGPQIANAHSYDYYWKMATGQVDVYYNGTNGGEYGAKYDDGEYKDGAKWNPCFTDDWQYATLFRGLLESIRYHTSWKTFYEGTTSVSFSICDNRVVCPCEGCTFIAAEGLEYRDEMIPGCGLKSLGCGEAGLNLYLANRACRDIQEYYGGFDEELGYYVGRPAGMQEYGDGEYSDRGYGEAITDAYPGLKLYTILYDHTLPHEELLTNEHYSKVAPADNLIIMYCGNPCNNHFIGSNTCNGGLNNLGQSGEEDAVSLKAWGEVCKQTGTEFWFWYYPVNYNTCLTDSPNIFNLWHDYKWAVEECNITGIFYEGGGGSYLFEMLKSHLSAMLMWSMQYDENGEVTMMSYDEFIACMKEYLEMFYGDGYEYIYEYIVMHDEAGNRNPCYINNCDYPGDMFNYEYMIENYETMRELLYKALALAEDEEVFKIECLIMTTDFLGLSATYNSVYRDGTDEAAKAEFAKRYEELDTFIRENGINLGVGSIHEKVFDLSVSPMVLYYSGGTWRPEWNDTWVWLGSRPGWGYA